MVYVVSARVDVAARDQRACNLVRALRPVRGGDVVR